MDLKAGWKTTEFWTTTLATIGGLLAMFGVHISGGTAATVTQAAAGVGAAAGLFGSGTAVQIAGGVAAGAAQVAYALSRGMAKKAAASAPPAGG